MARSSVESHQVWMTWNLHHFPQPSKLACSFWSLHHYAYQVCLVLVCIYTNTKQTPESVMTGCHLVPSLWFCLHNPIFIYTWHDNGINYVKTDISATISYVNSDNNANQISGFRAPIDALQGSRRFVLLTYIIVELSRWITEGFLSPLSQSTVLATGGGRMLN